MTAEGPVATASGGAVAGTGAITPDDLAIAGLVPLSSVDWPDHLAAVLFLQGCPWRCPYCQNAEILDTRTPGQVPFDYVRALLERRRGLLDGLVFSGGEALRQEALPAAIEAVRALGFQAALHTAGAYPRRFEQVLGELSWVGLDVKAMPGDYDRAAGAAGGAKVMECLEMLVGSGIDYEVRTTVYPGAPATQNFSELLALLREYGVANFALQEARVQGVDPVFAAMAQRWDREAWRERFAQMASEAEAAGFDRVTIRAA